MAWLQAFVATTQSTCFEPLVPVAESYIDSVGYNHSYYTVPSVVGAELVVAAVAVATDRLDFHRNHTAAAAAYFVAVEWPVDNFAAWPVYDQRRSYNRRWAVPS